MQSINTWTILQSHFQNSGQLVPHNFFYKSSILLPKKFQNNVWVHRQEDTLSGYQSYIPLTGWLLSPVDSCSCVEIWLATNLTVDLRDPVSALEDRVAKGGVLGRTRLGALSETPVVLGRTRLGVLFESPGLHDGTCCCCIVGNWFPSTGVGMSLGGVSESMSRENASDRVLWGF